MADICKQKEGKGMRWHHVSFEVICQAEDPVYNDVSAL
jgi:hypothetical protein